MTTAAKRDRKKANRFHAGRHTAFEHKPGERCVTCRPLPLTEEQRAARAAQAAARLAEQPARAWDRILSQAVQRYQAKRGRG